MERQRHPNPKALDLHQNNSHFFLIMDIDGMGDFR